ncbi:hypothetical protein AVEN_183011-1 [Araneus ventricosus]|uniref:Uncharacterized protein n=1 Tax=Araneus ventricosus TaxID=182803 RepID=A0A4Y2R0F9_ARAVE|nr:hypothetical protein AVEN_183011-1 [Araneus ventricosus]
MTLNEEDSGFLETKKNDIRLECRTEMINFCKRMGNIINLENSSVNFILEPGKGEEISGSLAQRKQILQLHRKKKLVPMAGAVTISHDSATCQEKLLIKDATN